jgi:hypothetical protein
MSAFTITNFRRLDKNSLRGVFDLELPSGLKINRCMLFEKNGKRWVGFPSEKFTKRDGTTSYSPILEFSSREVSDKFQKAVLPLAEQALGLVGA